MLKQLLRNTTLLSVLSLLHLTTSQSTTSTWGEPFSVDGPTGTASRENLLPSESQSIATTPLVNPIRSEETPSSIFTSVPTGTDVTMIEGTRQPSGSLSSFTASLPKPTGSGMTMSTETGAASTGGAVPAVPTGYRKLGFAGAVAGAAGVLFV